MSILNRLKAFFGFKADLGEHDLISVALLLREPLSLSEAELSASVEKA